MSPVSPVFQQKYHVFHMGTCWVGSDWDLVMGKLGRAWVGAWVHGSGDVLGGFINDVLYISH